MPWPACLPAGTGKNPIYEVWDPSNPTVTLQLNQSNAMVKNTNDIYYPNNYVLPSGDLFMFCNRYGEVINPLTGKVKAVVSGRRTGLPLPLRLEQPP